MIRPLALIPLALLLAACTTSGPENRLPASARAPSAPASSLEAYATASTTSSGSDAPAGRRGVAALVELPPGLGRVGQVAEQRFRGGIRQEIMLAPEGAAGRGNRVELVLVTGEAGSLEDGPGGPAKPTEAGIRAELRARFPGIDMRVVEREHRNAHGVYGLAVGRAADGARCLYAWQWIDSVRGSASGADPASLRVRLCRSGLTLDELAAQVEQIRLRPARAAAAPARAEAPEDAAPPSPMPARAPRKRTAAAGSGPRRHAEAASPPAARNAGEAEPIAADGRRYLASPAAGEPNPGPAPSSRPPVADLPKPSAAQNVPNPRGAYDRAPSPDQERPAASRPGGPRVGSSDGALPAQASQGQTAPGSTSAPQPLDPSLPPQAYLGPAASPRARAVP